MLDRMFPDSFDWSTWRNGSLHELGVTYKESEIIKSRDIIKKYAIGYYEGESLVCRPKPNTKAVMFLVDDRLFWTHLSNKEFKIIFEGSKVL